MTDEQNRPKPPAEGVVPTDITEIINRAVDTGIRSVVRTRLREKLGLIRV